MKWYSAEGLPLDFNSPVDPYLWAFLQHFLLELQELLLDGRLVESERQEVCEGLLLTEAVQENIDPCSGRDDTAAMLPGNHYKETKQYLSGFCEATVRLLTPMSMQNKE